LGIGPYPQSPIPNPQSPIPILNIFIFLIIFYKYFFKFNLLNKLIEEKIKNNI